MLAYINKCLYIYRDHHPDRRQKQPALLQKYGGGGARHNSKPQTKINKTRTLIHIDVVGGLSPQPSPLWPHSGVGGFFSQTTCGECFINQKRPTLSMGHYG